METAELESFKFQTRELLLDVHQLKLSDTEDRLIRMAKEDQFNPNPRAISLSEYGIIVDLSDLIDTHCDSAKILRDKRIKDSIKEAEKSQFNGISKSVKECFNEISTISESDFDFYFEKYCCYGMIFLDKIIGLGPQYSSLGKLLIIRSLERHKAIFKKRFGSLGYVYVMLDQVNGFRKIGYSNNPKYREKTLQSEKPTIALEWQIVARQEDEKHLHDLFKQKRVRGEWFNLSDDDLDCIYDGETNISWINHCGNGGVI